MNGSLKLISSNAQYKKYDYTYNGTTISNVHVFTTNSTQSIAPAISTTRTSLASLNPVKTNRVVAKTNACMFSYTLNEFYGFYYQGPGYPMYIDGEAHTTPPAQSILYDDAKYYPSFCVKSDGSATIRWFKDKAALTTALPYCDCIIASAHTLVYDSKCVFNTYVYDPLETDMMIYNISSPGTNDRFNTGITTRTANRTMLGHLTNGNYVMVVTDDPISLKEGANLMQDLKCDYAVNMDGSTPCQMRIAAGYGPEGKVTSGSGTPLFTAVCAYLN